MSKQKIISHLPSKKEWHTPGYNWNGPGTAIYERIGLNYKGGVGSSSYFLPVNKLDLMALRHDLLYYSPNPKAHSLADEAYMRSLADAKQSTGTLVASNVAIYSQMISRGVKDMGLSTSNVAMLAPMIRELGAAYVGGARPDAGAFMSIMNVIVNSGVVAPIKGIAGLYDQLKGVSKGVNEYRSTKRKTDEVMTKYRDYLSKVGHFDDTDAFVVKKDINEEDAKEAYGSFFRSFRDYIKFTNTIYTGTAGFKPYKVPKLNSRNLHLVSAPIASTPPIIYLTDAGKKIKDKMDSQTITIEDVLGLTEKGEKNDKPIYTTSSPTPMPSKSPMVEVEVPLSGPPSGIKVLSVSASASPSPSPAATPSPPMSEEAKIKKIKELYTATVQGDSKEAYAELRAFSKKSPADMKLVAKVVNDAKPFIESSHIYVRNQKSLVKHFQVLASMEGKTFIPPTEVAKGREIFVKYIDARDPSGSFWATNSEIKGSIVKSGKKFRKNLKKKDAIKAIEAVNERNALLGIKPLSTKGKVKELNARLQELNLGEVVSVYKRYPQFEPVGKEARLAAEMRRESRERTKDTFHGRLSKLSGLSVGESVRAMEKLRLEHLLSEKLISISDGKLLYTPKTYSKDFKKPEDVSEALYTIITDAVLVDRFEKALAKVKDTPEFRENSDVGRMNILSKAIKSLPTDSASTLSSLDKLKDSGFLDHIQTISIGPGKDITLESISDTIEGLKNLPSKDVGELIRAVEGYDKHLAPGVEASTKAALAATVDQPADIRVLPKGVKITPIDAKKEAKDILGAKVSRAKIIGRLEAIKKAKLDTKRKSKLAKLITEEEGLLEELKALSPEKKDAKGHQGGNIRRQGALRPHLKNPTEAAVKQAIGETPEQQMKDFTNWFTFDIPVDQTGVGSLNTNPLVKQNEAREKFLGEGTLYKHFNQTYQLTGGIEERKQFFVQHDRLFKEGVARGLLTRKVLSEEDAFLAKFSRGSNGLFPQDQTKAELNQFRDIYQTPNDFFGGVQYPMQSITNPSVMVDDFRKNTNLFTSP